MPRTAPEIRAEIAETKARLRALRFELKGVFPALRAKIIELRREGFGLDDIAAGLGLKRTVVVNNLHSSRVRSPHKRLWQFPVEQQRTYRKYRRNGVSAEKARALAGMTSGGEPRLPQAAAASPVVASAPMASQPKLSPSGRELP